MSYLSKLNVTQLKKPQSLSPAEHRRMKLVVKLEEQLALARGVRHVGAVQPVRAPEHPSQADDGSGSSQDSGSV